MPINAKSCLKSWSTILVLILAVLVGCAARGDPTAEGPPVALTAHPWPEADALFHQDPRWLGGDDAHSVNLGKGRVLWLFGDTLIASDQRGKRSQANMIRNSIAIQNGYDPAAAGMTFFWKGACPGAPASFFPESRNSWYWPGDGIRIGPRLLIFLAEIQTAANPLGFTVTGWQAVLIDNPDESPRKWQAAGAKRGSEKFDIVPGTGGILIHHGFMYAYGCDPSGRRAYLVRWPDHEAGGGNLSGAQWWCGQRLGWLAENRIQEGPAVLFTDAQSEFGVYHDARVNRYVQIQTVGFGAADLGFRTASRPEGPWSALRRFYKPDEKKIPGVLIYAAKPHVFMTGTGPAVTYATNHIDPNYLLEFPALYYPRVLQIALKTSVFE